MSERETPADPLALAILRATPATLHALVAGVPEDALSVPVDDGWSVRDVLAHVLDVEDVIFADRIGRMLREETPYIRSIDPTARLRARGDAARDAAALLDELARRRPADLDAVAGLTAGQLARQGQHDEAGPVSIADLVHQWAYHDLMHLQQVAKMLQSPLVPRMGNTRHFYDL